MSALKSAHCGKKLKKPLIWTIIFVFLATAALSGYIIVNNVVVIPNRNYEAAIALMNAGEYEKAIVAFEAMDGYKDSAAYIVDCKYQMAVALLEAEKYEEAIIAFEALDGYKDSNDHIANCKYHLAIALMNAGKYQEAIVAFEALDGYKYSATNINNCKYNIALSLLEAGKYDEAIVALRALNGYKDSAVLADKASVKKNIAGVQVGEYICFGKCEQDGLTSNGEEDIQWLVLAREENKILVISKFALEYSAYNNSDIYITWENSDIRKLMNESMLEKFFSPAEQALISTTVVSDERNYMYGTSPGNETQDKLFLLSAKEALDYFISDYSRRCIPTNYAFSENGYANKDIYTCFWWLRSPGKDQRHAAVVCTDGDVLIHGTSVFISFYAVRPAMWIDLDA